LLQALVVHPYAKPAASPIDGLILVSTNVAADPRMAGMPMSQDSQFRINAELPHKVHTGEIMNRLERLTDLAKDLSDHGQGSVNFDLGFDEPRINAEEDIRERTADRLHFHN